jgi:hAT family C-terminal dimerisation region
MSAMAKDVYAVPATGAGVEREFSISGNIVNRRRNRLSPKTISDLMQYKRWVARHGIIAKITVDQIVDDEIDEIDDVVESDDDTVEELVDWLRTCEKNKTLKKRVEALTEL